MMLSGACHFFKNIFCKYWIGYIRIYTGKTPFLASDLISSSTKCDQQESRNGDFVGVHGCTACGKRDHNAFPREMER